LIGKSYEVQSFVEVSIGGFAKSQRQNFIFVLCVGLFGVLYCHRVSEKPSPSVGVSGHGETGLWDFQIPVLSRSEDLRGNWIFEDG
jgi:hypothetical protein